MLFFDLSVQRSDIVDLAAQKLRASSCSRGTR